MDINLMLTKVKYLFKKQSFNNDCFEIFIQVAIKTDIAIFILLSTFSFKNSLFCKEL